MKPIPTPEVITPEMRDIFMALRKARRDFDGDGSTTGVTQDFIKWLNETYGIKLLLSRDGYNLAKNIAITDEKKYLFFVLKYKS